MNKRKKRQLGILGVVFLLLIIIFFAVKALPDEEPETEEALNFTIFTADVSDITEIGYISENGNFNLSKSDDKWICVEEAETNIDGSKVEDFINTVVSVMTDTKIENVTDLGQYGLLQPAMQVTLQGENNLYTINLGDFNAVIDAYYVTVNDETVVYTVDESYYTSLQKTITDFEAETVADEVSEE